MVMDLERETNVPQTVPQFDARINDTTRRHGH